MRLTCRRWKRRFPELKQGSPTSSVCSAFPSRRQVEVCQPRRPWDAHAASTEWQTESHEVLCYRKREWNLFGDGHGQSCSVVELGSGEDEVVGRRVQTLDGHRQQVRLTLLLLRNEWVDNAQLHVDLWLQPKNPRMQEGHEERGWGREMQQPTLGDSADAASRGEPGRGIIGNVYSCFVSSKINKQQNENTLYSSMGNRSWEAYPEAWAQDQQCTVQAKLSSLLFASFLSVILQRWCLWKTKHACEVMQTSKRWNSN